MKATDQADITGMVLIRNPFLSLTVHSQVQELDLSLNVYVPPFFFTDLLKQESLLSSMTVSFKWANEKKKTFLGPQDGLAGLGTCL